MVLYSSSELVTNENLVFGVFGFFLSISSVIFKGCSFNLVIEFLERILLRFSKANSNSFIFFSKITIRATEFVNFFLNHRYQ